MSVRLPKYRFHKGSGQALVQINGERTYLGVYDSPESHEKYRRLIAEWLSGNEKTESSPSNNAPVPSSAATMTGDDSVLVCPSLIAGRGYVSFNGNGVRRHRGYRLVGDERRGWLYKCGFPVTEDWAATARDFLTELAGLATMLELVVAAVDPRSKQWFDSRTQRPRFHVLLVDDSPVQRTAAAGVLRKCGFHVTCANDGREAVAALQKRDYDVVLMDVEMPVMDGLAATIEIRQREALLYTHTPIIAFTSTTDRDRCFAAGMDGFTAKPLKTADLELIFKIVSQVRLRLDARPA